MVASTAAQVAHTGTPRPPWKTGLVLVTILLLHLLVLWALSQLDISKPPVVAPEPVMVELIMPAVVEPPEPEPEPEPVIKPEPVTLAAAAPTTDTPAPPQETRSRANSAVTEPVQQPDTAAMQLETPSPVPPVEASPPDTQPQKEMTVAEIMARDTPPEPVELPPEHPPIPPELLEALNRRAETVDIPVPVRPAPPEPVRPVPSEPAEPVKAEPIKAEPARVQPARARPVNVKPAQPEPTRPLPVTTQTSTRSVEPQPQRVPAPAPVPSAPKAETAAPKPAAAPAAPARSSQSGSGTGNAQGLCPVSPKPDLRRLDLEPGDYRVILQVNISASGKVTDVRVTGQSGYPELDRAAVETVRRKWQCQPETENGQPVDTRAKQAFDIKIN